MRRWEYYVVRSGPAFAPFWRSHLSGHSRDVLLLVGGGFDPRMTEGPEAIIGCDASGRRDLRLINFNEGETSPSRRYDRLTTANRERLLGAVGDSGSVEQVAIPMLVDGRRAGSRKAAELAVRASDLAEYQDVIVDVSAMPRSIYMSIIAKYLYLYDSARSVGQEEPANVHVVVAENPHFDRSITQQGIDENATFIHGFAGRMENKSTEDLPCVWIPMLGEGRGPELERIQDLVQPNEIVPLLPFPSADPRRRDNLLIEYRELLFHRWNIEPDNVIFASEQNPFDAYRQLHAAISHYRQALASLGGCRIAVSALSSKLLSIGAILTAHECKQFDYPVAIAHVEVQGYRMLDIAASNAASTLFTLWLTGEAYAT